MAPIISTLWDASVRILRNGNLQHPLQAPVSDNNVLSSTILNFTQEALARSGTEDGGSFRGGPQIAGIDLVAMLVSDSGLASTEPVWWNTSPTGCFLLGLQPRGGWQVMQRTVQWGDDRLTKAFGVNCTKPHLYAYLACNIRNRIEVWNSTHWSSPMQGEEESNSWIHTSQSFVNRPTKLIDGSRGGQAFICELLRPKDGQHHGIEQQARIQFLSVLLVAAGLMKNPSLETFKKMLADDFALTVRLGSVFTRLRLGIALANIALILALSAIAYHFWAHKILGSATSYVVELCSIASWAVGSVALLMQGGNPRVALVDITMPTHVQERYEMLLNANFQEPKLAPTIMGAQASKYEDVIVESKEISSTAVHNDNSKGLLKIAFGSLHGSVYLSDKGYCYCSPDTVHFVCSKTIELRRPWQWYTSVLWGCVFLIISIVLQIVHTHVASIGSVTVGIIILLATSILRGTGISGPEEWQIPAWKQRKGAKYGARLQGALSSR